MNNKLKILGILIMSMLIVFSCKKDEKTSVSVASVSLSKTSLSLAIEESSFLTATVLPKEASSKAITWSSSNEAVATVDEKGKVTGVKAGKSTITVTTKDGDKTAKCEVTVKAAVTVASISLSETSLELTEGETAELDAKVLPKDASNKAITWSSSDEAVATVDESGKVKAEKEGSSTITVATKDGSKKATCVVTVKTAPVPVISVTSVRLSQKSLDLFTGKTADLTATVFPKDANNRAVKWSSSDEAVASVDKNGKVKAFKEGNATITVTTEDGSKTATCNVKVEVIILEIGSTYQGGKIAYIFKEGEPGYVEGETHGIIAAPSDQSESIKWNNGSNITTGATGEAIGTGKTNTDKIVVAQGSGNYAAKLCYDLSIDGYDDWYLPSKDELNELYVNQLKIGGFRDHFYLSSSESDSDNVFLQSFDNGESIVDVKDYPSSVRAVRTF